MAARARRRFGSNSLGPKLVWRSTNSLYLTCLDQPSYPFFELASDSSHGRNQGNGITLPAAPASGLHPAELRDFEMPAALPRLGLGTWKVEGAMATTAVSAAIACGYRLIDCADYYENEAFVGAALREALSSHAVSRRADLYIVSKVIPSDASRRGTVAACLRSLERLQVEYLDLYLLHWRGPHPLADTIAAFEELRAAGRVRAWGVSNFDTASMEQLWAVPDGRRCAVNQVYYSPSERGVEYDLLPWLADHGVACMAYCPLDMGAVARSPALAAVGAQDGAAPCTAAQAALRWVTRRRADGLAVTAIPKASSHAHLLENFAAASLPPLTATSLEAIDAAFPPPTCRARLRIE